jgi:aminoglycoside phosphotransferase (APT) family kinase protein
MLDLLGEGAFAVVRSGQCRRTGKKVAIKVIPTTRQSAAAVRAEVSVLKQVSLHTCIAKFMDVYEHADEGKFYIVMEFVDGRVIRTFDDAAALSVEQRQRAGESLIDVMAAIHQVDLDAVGLADLGKQADYIPRQLHRWYGQFQRSEGQVEGGLGLPAVHEVHDRLAASVPEQIGATDAIDTRRDGQVRGPERASLGQRPNLGRQCRVVMPQ